ncbi:hypothetical protein HmCmsJML160_01610 [Escherichia coli]|nr:hypothetical protein HmCmsJML160_01610 [Escherichia coli]
MRLSASIHIIFFVPDKAIAKFDSLVSLKQYVKPNIFFNLIICEKSKDTVFFNISP